MKKLQRLTAALLLIATLMSFVVPATFADAGTNTEIVYDFELYRNSDFKAAATASSFTSIVEDRINFSFRGNDKYDGTNRVEAWFFNNYGTKGAQINWAMETAKGSNSDNKKNYGFRGKEDYGMRLTATTAGQYASVRINVPAADTYALGIEGGFNTNTVDVYIFKAATAYGSGTLTSQATIEAAMTAENLVADNVVTADKTVTTLGQWTFDEAGDYIVVFKVKEAKENGVELRAMTMQPVEVEEPSSGATEGTTVPAAESINYDFQLVTNSQFSFADADKYNKVSGTIKSAYKNGTHNWMLETAVSTVSNSSDMRFYGKNDNIEGLRLMNLVEGEWIALRMKVAQAGNYEVALTGGATSAHPYQAIMYAFAAPANTSADNAMTAADIEAKMVNGNLVGVANITADSSQDVAGEHTFAEGDNILVIKLNPSGSRASIQDIDLTPKAPSGDTTEPTDDTTVPAKEEKIDFELYYNDAFSNEIKGGYEKYDNKKALIENAYAAGTLNWKLEAMSSGLVPKFVINNGANQGIRTDSVNGKYVAVRFKVSEPAKYDVIYNSVYGYNFGAKTWIVPAPTADTVDIAAAMVDANKMGNVAITTSVLSCDLGSYDFAAGEYVLIFEGTGERLYMGNIVLTEAQGDQEETTDPSEDTTAPEETTQPSFTFQDNVFEFELYNYSNFSDRINGVSNKYSSVKSTVENAYPAVNNWVIEACSAGTSFSSLQFNAAQRGFRMNVEADNWVAIRLNVTKAGKYEVVLNCLYNAGYPYDAKAWLFPAAAQTMTAAEVEAAMVAANAMSDVSIGKDRDKSILGEYEFAVGEYILVMKAVAARMYITTLQLAELGSVEKPPEDTRPDYVAQPGFFEMELYNYKGTGIGTSYTKYSKVQTAIANGYPNKFNWKLEAFSKNLDIDSIQFVEDGADSAGLRMKEENTAGEWIALRLNNTVSGVKELTLRSEYGAYNGKVWLFPAAAEAMTVEQIAALMTDKNFVGNVKFTSEADACILTEREFAAGEYIIVVQAEKDKLYLDSISIADKVVEAPKDPVDKMVYDMDLVKMDPQFNDKGFTNWYDSDTKTTRVYSKIAQMYEKGIINWKYESMSDTASRFNCRVNHTQVKVSTNFSEINNAWNAIRISAPGAGTYDVRLYSDELSSVIADIYLIPARTGIAMTNEQIEAAMTGDNLLVSNALIDGRDTFYLGEYTFGTEHEYVMVFKFTRGKKVYFNNIQMTKDGLVADTEIKKLPTYNGVVYDFDIGDKYTGILQPLGEYRYDAPTPKEAGYASPYEQIKSFWNSGKINWKWIAASEDLGEYDDNMNQYPGEYIRFYQDTGMYIYSKPDSWVAFQIKSPGEGDFTLTMNHAVAANDGTVAVYILPADTPLEEIYDTTDPSNRVGKVLLTKPDGSAGKEDGFESFVGYWNFEAGKEYILVLEAYAASQFSATLSNMNITNIVMQKGIHEYKTDDTKTVKPITVKQNVFATSDLGNGNVAVFEMNGMDYYLTQLEGGTINLYNLTTGELEKTNYLATARPRLMAVAPDGKVWMTGGGKFLACYDPVENTVTKTKTFMPKEYKHNGFNYMTITPEGIIYAGLHLRSNVIKYDPSTKQFTDLGYFVDPDADITGLLYVDGYLYSMHYIAGVCNKAVKYNIATGEVEGEIDFIEHCDDQSCTHLSLLGDDIIVVGGKTTDNDHTMAFNKDTMEFVDLGLPGSVSKTVTSEINGKQYMVLSTYGLYEYDVETKEIIKTPGFTEMTGTGFRAGDQHSFGKSWAMINGDLCLISNDSQVTSCPRVVNLTKKEYYRWTDLTRDASGGGSRIISFTETEPGAGELVMGHWNAEFITTYNIYTGELTFMDSAGQTDSIGYYKGILYGGCYSATVLVELHRETEEIIQRFKLDHDLTGQKRLLSMETGGDHVFVGSVPGSFINGGALTVYNTITGQWYYERNLVQDQSIVDMAYSNELVFAASSREGGDNSNPAGDSAVIVAYDYLNREKLAVLDPRDYIPGLASPVHYIYGLTADPYTEENGRVWAIVSDTLFCFTFDRETKKFNVQEVFSLGKTVYTETSGVDRTQRKIEFIPEKNQMYLTLWGNGVYKMNIKDWMAPIGQVKITSNEKLMGYKPEDYIIAEDGNLYFGDEADLMMMPLNVTDEDWAIAEKMDAQIQAIHDSEITLASESAIRTARSDYENLSWRYKALVQNLELLQEAESDILECLIDDGLLKAGEIDADDYPAMLALHEQYEGLTTTRQKRYVKNYKNLKEAYELSSSLNDQRIAAAMQEKVNALKDIMPIESLEKEPEVVAVRTEFAALPGRQRILVDTKILEEAEAQIAVLRAELVKQVEELIQAIPAEITLEAEPAITAAREGVDKLYALERKQVSYTKLETAEAKLRNLKNALAKAEQFDALMKEIGIVTLGDAERIANARKVYNSLNETARAFCKKAGKLNRAEFILAGLQTWMIPVIVVVDAAAVFAVLWFVPSLHQKVFKAKKKEEEPVEETSES